MLKIASQYSTVFQSHIITQFNKIIIADFEGAEATDISKAHEDWDLEIPIVVHPFIPSDGVSLIQGFGGESECPSHRHHHNPLSDQL